MGRTNKLVDGCYSFWQVGAWVGAWVGRRRCSWLRLGSILTVCRTTLDSPTNLAPALLRISCQGGVFPLLAELLQRQLAHREQGGQPATTIAAGPGTAATEAGSAGDASAAAAAAAALRLSKLLLGEAGPSASDGSDGEGSSGGGGGGPDSASELADWVAALPRLSPLAAAQRRQEELKSQLDSAVEASIEAEERYTAAAGVAAAGPLQQEALAQLERASDLQKALYSCQRHTEALRCGAAALLAGVPVEAAVTGGEGEQAGRLPQLYDARALQLWLLKCCQSVRGFCCTVLKWCCACIAAATTCFACFPDMHTPWSRSMPGGSPTLTNPTPSSTPSSYRY